MANFDYDLVIIGSGPGGYVAAIRAHQLGLKTAIIEKDKPGGVCLNIGCIPSKSLIHQAEEFRTLDEMAKIGVKIDKSGFAYKKVFDKSRKAADTLSKGVQFLLKKNKADYLTGTAKITGPNEVTIDGEKKVSGKHILVATGSRPRQIPGFEVDEKTVLTSNGALMLEELPKRMLVLGSGAIGIELAYVFSAYGVEVEMVEMLDRILPLEDQEVVKAVVEKALKRYKIKTHISTKATGMTKKGKAVVVNLENADGKKSEIETDMVLVAVGRQPNSEDLGLEDIGVKLERGYVVTGDYYRTDVPSIYAIGDVIAGSPMLAHVASKEGEMAVEHMAGHAPALTKIDNNNIPNAVYCEPQVASFGYTEARATEAGVDFAKATFPYRGAGKSVAVEKSDGLVKILFDPKSKEIIGAHVAGADATELIHELLLARQAELLPEDIATMVHAHPTLSEAVMEAARAAEGWAIHV
jgi:dihydrolipoamide dehydrogenase